MNLSNKNTSEPAIPGPTCKYVDHKDFYGHVSSTLKGELELLREYNRTIREVDKY